MEFREPFHHLGIVVIEESGLLLVQSVNRGHIVGSQFEVKDVDILANTIGLTLFGMQMMPLWSCQRRTTWR